MHLILTHEQADFDALASLFAAHLLDEQSLPVLPRRVNRNLRAFLTLYGAEFPFVDPRDIPAKTVSQVTLVDTQSLITLKGMGPKTSVRVIDHHPRRENLPDEWQVTVDETGANTTLLLEAIQHNNGHFSPLQATLLLLGIYEDTGSLTYTSTTPRDARAAAYLLEYGANLNIAVEFLNPPLSGQQRKVYDELTASAQAHHIHGQRIVIACGDASQMDEEISTLAHKLRDLLDPDALFVLVTTSEGIRMVARSTSDNIDVGAVAARFGGGGHDRAAAALIRPESAQIRLSDSESVTQSVTRRLLALLPEHVIPSVTVAQIMSRRPQVLTPETPAQDAARLMQRTGFEGYPVVDDGRVVGLLTRRAVDRALAHKINLTAISLMEAGEVTVRPDDSIQHLQTRMVDSGWGQVPVIDPDDGEVIGIVTRTDLLKILGAKTERPYGANLAVRLEAALPEARHKLIRGVAEQAVKLNMAVYVVGGFVRDLILERPSLDFDIVVEGDAIELGRALVKQNGGRFTSHTRFGTAKWFLAGSSFADTDLPEFLDLISARTEFYEHPTALPTVARGSIKLDLHRRDFTINTLALRLDGHHYGDLHDYWGGLADLERGLVRVLHSLSFVDDPTRMLRAVRFEQRFGFEIEQRTRELMDAAHPLLARLSGERIRHELDLMLDEPPAAAMLDRLDALGLLKAIHPVLPWTRDLRAIIESGLEAPAPSTFGLEPDRRSLGVLLWLLSLSVEEIESVAGRLRFPATLTKTLLHASRLWQVLPSLAVKKPSQWTSALEDIPLLAIYAVYLRSTNPAISRGLADYLSKWRHVQPVTDGHMLRQRGLPPGPVYQKILGRLRSAWLDGEVTTTEEERQLLEELLRLPT
jgi:tRNA nucleotidyltransferase (CCA-adding enzyme)